MSRRKQGSSGANKKAIKFDELFSQARSNFNLNRFDKADSFFEKSLATALARKNNEAAALAYFGWAVSLSHQKKLDEALDLIAQARERFGNFLDAYFLEIMAYYSAGKLDAANRACLLYLEKHDAGQDNSPAYLNSSSENYLEILWLASDVAWKMADFKRSLDYQKKALELEPNNQYRRIVHACNLGKNGEVEQAIEVLDEGKRRNPSEIAFENAKALIYGDAELYDKATDILQGILSQNNRDTDAIVNLGVISEKRGDYDKALEYFKDALKINPHHDVAKSNLEHLAETIDSRPQRISLCMIVKNEEKYLPGCLKTVHGLVDEIIVVDTGSTDRTMEIARHYGAKIYEHPWQNDFSLHRNQSIDYATGDWILILDADEELDPSEHNLIRSAIKRKNIDAITFVVYNKIQSGRVGFLNSHRMFRNGKGYHYSGIVHNQLIMDGSSLSSQLKVYHHGYGLSDEQMRAKGRRTEALLMKQLEENPDNAFAHFNLAQIYRGLGEPQKSLDHALRVIEQLSPENIDRRHVYVMALDQIGCAYVGLEQLDKAKEHFYKALEIKEDYLDPLFNLGYVYSREGNFDKADELFKRYLAVREKFSEHREWIGLILNNLNSQFAVYYGLGLSQIYRNNPAKALEYFKETINQVEDFEYTHHLIARCYRSVGDPDKIIYHCDRAIEFGHEDAEIYLLKGEAFLNKKEPQKAAECFKKSLQFDNGYFPSQLGLVSAASLDGDYARALALVDEALANSPKSPQALAARGDLLYHSGDFDSAALSYRDQAVINPNDPIAWNNLGNCFLKQSNFASADESYRKALEERPDFALSYRNMAVSFLRQNRREEAAAYFEKYLSMGGNDCEVLPVLADIHYGERDYWKAIRYFEEYIRQSPAQLEALIRLSDCYFNLRKFDAASLGYRAVLKMDPNNTIAMERLRGIERGAKLVVG